MHGSRDHLFSSGVLRTPLNCTQILIRSRNLPYCKFKALTGGPDNLGHSEQARANRTRTRCPGSGRGKSPPQT
ncbi:hypothetical protein V8C42DRAFT_304522 [Trichoderma barbatum]